VASNRKLIYKNYEIWFLVLIVFIALLLLFVLVRPQSKQIYELKKLDNGNYNITGYISNLKVDGNYTKFRLNDSTDSINIYANYTITDLYDGKLTTIICNLQTNQYGKSCYIID